MDIKRLLSFNRRDYVGFFCWWLLSVLFGVFALPLMIAREIWQWKHYHLSHFEWEDVIRYGVDILLSVAIRYALLGVSAYRLIL